MTAHGTQTAIKYALAAVVNLSSLTIDEHLFNKTSSTHTYYLDFDLLIKSTNFRLKSFRVFRDKETIREPRAMVSFLLNQPGIEDWVQMAIDEGPASALTEDMLSPPLLPLLSTFEMHCHYPYDLPLLKSAISRPLVRLALLLDNYGGTEEEGLDPFRRVMECVRGCHQTLLLLNYCDMEEDSPPEVAVGQLCIIAQQLPRLKTLSYSCENVWITVRLNYQFVASFNVSYGMADRTVTTT